MKNRILVMPQQPLDYQRPEPAQPWYKEDLVFAAVTGGVARAAASRRCRWLVFAGVSLVVCAVAIGWWRVRALEFEPSRWKAASKAERTRTSVRQRMAESFLAEQQPVGKTREQIVALLGEPDDTPYFRDRDNMVYYLGPEPGLFGIDSQWLVIRLRDGIASEAQLATD